MVLAEKYVHLLDVVLGIRHLKAIVFASVMAVALALVVTRLRRAGVPPRLWVSDPRFRFGLGFAFFGAFTVLRGIDTYPDTGRYDEWSDALLGVGFDPLAFASHTALNDFVPSMLYFGFTALMAFSKMILGAHWPIGVGLVNIACMSTVVALVASIAVRATEDRVAGWMVLVLSGLSIELRIWTRALLSDVTFLALVTVAMWLMIEARTRGGVKYWAGATAVSILCAGYRPTGMLMMVVLFGVACTRPDAGLRERWLRRGAIAGLVLASVFINAYVAQHPARNPVPMLGEFVRYQADHYRTGEIMWKRVFVEPPHDFVDYVAITGTRFVYYFIPGFPSEGLGRFSLLLLFYAPVYLGGLVALTANRGKRGDRWKASILVAMWMVGVFALAHAAIEVDYNWRYRLPVVPALMLAAAIGMVTWRTPESRHGRQGSR